MSELPSSNLFSSRSRSDQRDIVNVRYFTAFPKCNYSCSYCIAGHGETHPKPENTWDPDRYLVIIENLTKLSFKINIRLGVNGEFFLDQTLVEGGRRLSLAKNIVSLNLITNLSFSYAQYKRLLSGYRQEKIAIVASFHPTEIANHKKWIETAALMASDYDLAAILVAYPPLLGGIAEFRTALLDRKIETFVQPYIGSFAGKSYPQAYTPAERAKLRAIMYSRHDVEFLLNLKQPGMCNAGFRSLFVDSLGRVFPCGMGPYPSPLGDLATSSEVRLDLEPRACPFKACQCDTENMNTLQFAQFYRRDSLNQHRYHYRLRAQALLDSSLDEWRVLY